MRKSTLAAIRAHAVAAYPRECVGYVVSTPDGKQQYLPGVNVTTNPGEMFRTRAEDWAAAEDAGEILAFVHSHPDQSAAPSAADRVACEELAARVKPLVWYIVEVRKGDDGTVACGEVHSFAPEGYQAPLLGRPFFHGVLDCYAIIRDWYKRERGIELSDFEREDGWWEGEGELYLDNFEAAGFRRLAGNEVIQPGDVIIMQHLSARANHGAVFLGDQPLAERPDLHPLPDAMLHHLHGRPSERAVYGGYWLESTRAVLRYIGGG